MCFSPARVITENIQKTDIGEVYQMLGPLDKMFDFNRDGRLDVLEQASRAAFLTKMMEEDEKDDDKDDED